MTGLSTACATIPPACTADQHHGHVSTSVFFSPAFGGTGTQVVTNTSFLESLLNAGYDVVLGVWMAGTDWQDASASTGSIDVVTTTGPPFGGQAVAGKAPASGSEGTRRTD